ncbi:MAG: precorrin-2 C(20)-methyltransferase [Alphaproteobacteria bacterium]|nr:precorrin-2 C(20)-methyltransferase [Alphaproteobacteria bacterium]
MTQVWGIGVGPGDPELLTIKALKIIQKVDILIFPQTNSNQTMAYNIVQSFISDKQKKIFFDLPLHQQETERKKIYTDFSAQIVDYINKKHSIAIICEGDPFFYGSFIYLYMILKDYINIEIVPGISSVLSSSSAAKIPMVFGTNSFLVLPAILPDVILREKIKTAESVVFIKIGRHFPKLFNILRDMDLDQKAMYVEYATSPNMSILPLNQVDKENIPYFSLILIPNLDNIFIEN